MERDRKIALLIDCDNASHQAVDGVLNELAKYGVTNIRRAYGNWKTPHLKGWEEQLHPYAIQPIQQFAYTQGKNATDAAMIIDAMDLLYTQQLDAFALMTSDSDFTPLVMRILTNGLTVYGFGEQKTPLPFVNALFLTIAHVTMPRQHPPAKKCSRTKKTPLGEINCTASTNCIHIGTSAPSCQRAPQYRRASNR